MKALCIALKGGNVSDPWLTLNHEYQVLSILMTSKGPAKLRVLADDGRTPILAEACMFAMTSQVLPSNWVGNIREEGVVEFGPPSWLNPGFWERYFDGDSGAVEEFQREMRNMGNSPGQSVSK